MADEIVRCPYCALDDGFRPMLTDGTRMGGYASKPISVVQLLKLCDLGAETPNLVAKHCEMIHVLRITHPERLSVGQESSATILLNLLGRKYLIRSVENFFPFPCWL